MYFHPLNTNIPVPSTKNQNILEKSDKYRQISPNIDEYRFIRKFFDFWLVGPKYSCSADENTSEKCLVTKKFLIFFRINFWYFFESMQVWTSFLTLGYKNSILGIVFPYSTYRHLYLKQKSWRYLYSISRYMILSQKKRFVPTVRPRELLQRREEDVG